MNFRTLAEKNEVKPEWIGRIEDVLLTHLREWGFDIREQQLTWTTASGQHITNVYLEQAYKVNIHLCATIDGKPRCWIFRSSFPEYTSITSLGIPNVPADMLKQLVEERI